METAARQTWLQDNGLTGELEAISTELYTVGALFPTAAQDETLTKGLQEILTTISNKVSNMARGILPQDAL